MKPMQEGAAIMLRVEDAIDIENVRRWLSDILAEGQTATVTIQIAGDLLDVVRGLDTMDLIQEAVQGL